MSVMDDDRVCCPCGCGWSWAVDWRDYEDAVIKGYDPEGNQDRADAAIAEQRKAKEELREQAQREAAELEKERMRVAGEKFLKRVIVRTPEQQAERDEMVGRIVSSWAWDRNAAECAQSMIEHGLNRTEVASAMRKQKYPEGQITAVMRAYGHAS